MKTKGYLPPKVDCRYGAPLGRRPVHPRAAAPDWPKLRLALAPVTGNGYDTGGAYWGWDTTGVDRLYVAWSGDHSVQLFTWARSRLEAEQLLQKRYPGIGFKRSKVKRVK